MDLYIHTGAPRTGTSFLRKWIFPNFKDTSFYNKQGILTRSEQEVVDFFSTLSHYGDGDELSSQLNDIAPPSFPDKNKVIISEEHLIWSVYHMMGNIGSRALLLKKNYPDAKIILTIRRQPEYFISIFKYLQDYDNSHIKPQLSTIFKMLNVYEAISRLKCTRFGKIPVGIKLETQLSLFDIDSNYFMRKIRHFISADFSWFRIYEIYSDLFGKSNVLVLPQEMLLNDQQKYIDTLSEFIGKEITSPPQVRRKVNTSPEVPVFKNKDEKETFKNFILTLNQSSNLKLNAALHDGLLETYGYCEPGAKTITSRQIGFTTQNRIEIDSKRLNKLKIQNDRLGTIHTCVKTIPLVYQLARTIIKNRLLTRTYYALGGFIERLQGLDFSKIEPLEGLNLQKETSKQYETTKLFELKKWLKRLPEDIEYNGIDFGSGKGTVLIELAKNKKFKQVHGVEISEKLNTIAKKNLKIKNINHVDLITLDASETPMELIDGCNFFFFYNPFPYPVFQRVFEKIEASIQHHKRDAVIVYFNPLHSEIIDNSPFFVTHLKLKNILSLADTHIYRACFDKKEGS